MNRTSFTSIVPPETKLAIIRKIPLYINPKCSTEYYHLQRSDTFIVDILSVDGLYLAEIEFSDKGAKVTDRVSKKVKIDVKGLTDLWRDELSANFGAEYLNYLNKITHRTDYTI